MGRHDSHARSNLGKFFRANSHRSNSGRTLPFSFALGALAPWLVGVHVDVFGEYHRALQIVGVLNVVRRFNLPCTTSPIRGRRA